ncbi:f-box-like domain-containing protein [Ditylenchus destructor]|uniref:F-box-like domain-containing protein n=1 Tax=Ditylenchus destructor TaxID=166010 RepID=A0AAD4MMC7_9BILA|nr:f-box-like domain-containing protein [Ditylenchus destructor]
MLNNDVLCDVFRLLPRKQLAHSVQLVCRQFRRLAEYPTVPNLHRIHNIYPYQNFLRKRYNLKFWQRLKKSYRQKSEWCLLINIRDCDDLYKKSVIRPDQLAQMPDAPPYLRIGGVCLEAEHLARKKWRAYLAKFKDCLEDAHLYLSIGDIGYELRGTSHELSSFIIERVLPLFSNCIVWRIDYTMFLNDDGPVRNHRWTNGRSLSKTTNFTFQPKKDMQAPVTLTASPLILSLNNIYISNIDCFKHYEGLQYSVHHRPDSSSLGDGLIGVDEILEWLHHKPDPTRKTTIVDTDLGYGWRTDRQLRLGYYVLRGSSKVQSVRDWAEDLVMKIKTMFLEAKSVEDAREFCLILDKNMMPFVAVRNKCEIEFCIRNDVTNEYLILRKALCGSAVAVVRSENLSYGHPIHRWFQSVSF